MAKYTDYNTVLDLLGKAQDADRDMRVLSGEQRDFLHLTDGQWEPSVWRSRDNRPRYTIDKTTPLIEETTGRIKKSDFGIKVEPVDNLASPETAEVLGGLMRNSSNLSGADHIYNQAVTSVVEAGLDGWEVVHDYVNGRAVNQDLLFIEIEDFLDRVWFDHANLSRTPENARHAFKLTTYAKDDYEARWPEGSGKSVSDDSSSFSVHSDRDEVTVGQIYYLVESDIVLVEMSDGKTYEDNKDFKKIADELKDEGITEVSRRDSKVKLQWIRQFDGGDFLKEAEETVFELISLCPEYGKYAVINSVATYRGMTLKQMDAQRLYNYARSRQIEEGALSPRDKFLATTEQIEGYETEWETANTNSDATLPYNHVNGQPPPFKIGASQINPGLSALAADMTQDMREVANKFSVATSDNMNARAGVVIDELKESSDTGDIDWTEGHEVALCYGYKVWLTGVRKVYGGTRVSRVQKENGDFSMEKLNTTRFDEETQTNVSINDLSVGLYDVTCSAGKSYKTRQGETISGILEIGAVDPNVIMEGEDILVAASDGPGMKDIAERIRMRKMKEGSIPPSQFTEEETQQAIQAQQEAQSQPPQPDPLMIAAQAEMQKAQAEQLNAQNKQVEIQGNQQISMANLQLENKKIDLETQKFIRAGDDKFNTDAAKIDQGQQSLDQKSQQMIIKAQQDQERIDLDARGQEFNEMKTIIDGQQEERKLDQAARKQEFDEMKTIIDGQQQQLNDAVNNLNTLRSAIGADTIIGPTNTEAYRNQAETVTDLQEGTEGADVDIVVVDKETGADNEST